MVHAATCCCASTSWHFGSSGAVQLGFHSKPHLAFSSAVSSVYWAASCFAFFFSSQRQQIKRPPHTVNSTYWYSLHRKEVTIFLMSYTGNKSSVSSNQSWLSRVHWCFNPTAPASHRNRVRAWRPLVCSWRIRSGCDFVTHAVVLIRINTAFSTQPACSASQMKLYFPKGNPHLFGLIFSTVCLFGYILRPLKNAASKWFQWNMSVCQIKTFSVNVGVTWGN